MRKLLATCALVLGGCSSTPPTDVPDASLPGVPRIDVSEWTGVVSEQTTKLLEQLGRAWAGQSADLDGDGKVDLLALRDADGALTYRYEPSANGRPGWLLERLPDGHERLSMDLDERTFWDVVIDDYPDGRRLVMKDRDFNNKYDFRSTATRTVTGDGWEVVEEEDATETGTWTETRRYRMDDVAWQGAKCNGFRNWVVAPELANTRTIGQTTIGFAGVPSGPQDDSTSLACTQPHRDKLMRAFACALDRLGCLDLANREFATLAWATVTTRKILVGCGNDCAGAIAATDRVPDADARSRMAWNPAEIDRLSDQDLCSTALHEMLHWAGAPHDKANHDDGSDQIYACGHYCGGCTHEGPLQPPRSSMEDCVVCAGSEEERVRCGWKQKLADITCPTYNLCHGGIGVNAACSTCQGIWYYDCMDSKLSDAPEFYCCATCAPPADRANDKPCTSPPTLRDSCNQPPPECP
ncbi:MAG: hypothetical protein AMXMBFR34_07580 [Myxococcaceae bacterium]